MRIIIVLFSLFLIAKGQQLPVLQQRCAALPTTADTFIRNNFNCNGYHVCRNRAYLGSAFCGAGLYFDGATRCDFAHTVPCAECSATALALQRVPVLGSCNQYAICINDEADIQTCGQGSIWDRTAANCVTPPPSDSPAIPCSVCPNIYTLAFLDVPHFADCNRYIRCFSGTTAPSILTCPVNQLFDATTRGCVPAPAATCGAVAERPGQCNPTGVHYIPHESDCRSYWICANGIRQPNPSQCSEGFGFNPVTSLCVPGSSIVPPCLDNTQNPTTEAVISEEVTDDVTIGEDETEEVASGEDQTQ